MFVFCIFAACGGSVLCMGWSDCINKNDTMRCNVDRLGQDIVSARSDMVKSRRVEGIDALYKRILDLLSGVRDYEGSKDSLEERFYSLLRRFAYASREESKFGVFDYDVLKKKIRDSFRQSRSQPSAKS
jgi:hypothetical protein